VYLIWGEPMEMVQSRVARMNELSQEFGRKVSYGLRTHVVVRETESEAIEAANRMISKVDPQVRENFVRSYAKLDSTGQTNQVKILQQALERGDLFIEPHLWAGVGMARSGVGVAIVGDPQQVAAKIQSYVDIGITNFIFSGYPHVDECRRFGELVMPLVKGGISVSSGDRKLYEVGVAPTI
jgi:alkanesulfonate monooxygenase